MMYQDEMRILAEMETFTQADFAHATGTTETWASKLFSRLESKSLLERVRVGHSWLYALTERGKRAVDSLPVLDPEERTLIIECDGHEYGKCPCCGGGIEAPLERGRAFYSRCLYCLEWLQRPKGAINAAMWAVDDIPF